MKTPTVIDDGGNSLGWGTISPYSVTYEFPFAKVGDGYTFNARQRYKIDKNSYRPRPVMTAQGFNLGLAYLTELGTPNDIGCGIYDVEDTFQAVPIARYEYGSYNYTQQWYATIGNTGVDPTKYFYDVTWDLTEQSFTVAASFYYEYFLNSKPEPLLKSRAFMLFQRLVFINAQPPNGGSSIIADDSTITIYGGTIYQRKTPYINITPYGIIG